MRSTNVDLGLRPKSYFWSLGLESHLLSRVKGAERRAALKELINAGRVDDIPDFLARSALSDADRRAIGSIHPAFMGGEYLPDLMPDEVMIARITIASTDKVAVRRECMTYRSSSSMSTHRCATHWHCCWG